MSLRIRRGTDAQRSGITFDQGEIIWTTDSEKLYIGDGVTQGGKNIAAQLAGTGLQWNAVDQVLETEALSFNTDQITEGSNNKYFSVELAQDAAASLFTTGTHAGISFVYNDVDHKINATVSIDQEVVQDSIAPLFIDGIHSGITFSYDDLNNRINAFVTITDEVIQDDVAPMFTNGIHYGLDFVYDDEEALINASIDTDTIQDIVAGLFLSGTNIGISYFYDDDLNVINTTVDFSLESDIAPKLTADLDLNESGIIGDGFLDIPLITTNQYTGEFTVGRLTGLTSLKFYNDASADGELVNFNTVSNGTAFPYFNINVFKDSINVPGTWAADDYVGAWRIQAWNENINDYSPTLQFYALYTDDADPTKVNPKSKMLLVVGNNTDDGLPDTIASFDGNGVFSAPILQTGSVNPPVDIPTPAEGMIVYNPTTCKYMGYVSDTGLAGGGPSNSTPGWVELN